MQQKNFQLLFLGALLLTPLGAQTSAYFPNACYFPQNLGGPVKTLYCDYCCVCHLKAVRLSGPWRFCAACLIWFCVQCLDMGDIIVGVVTALLDAGLILTLLAVESGMARDIDQLKITVCCPCCNLLVATCSSRYVNSIDVFVFLGNLLLACVTICSYLCVMSLLKSMEHLSFLSTASLLFSMIRTIAALLVKFIKTRRCYYVGTKLS